jgi:Core-2/I-Branching enzyme
MASIRIAFLILAHRNANQIERLCQRLRPHNIFVHVDARTADFPTKQLAELPGVTLVWPRKAVHWGDFSMVEATLTLLNSARSVGSFDRYVLLSGECYPAKPIATLEEAFEANSQREWISLTPIIAGSHLETMIGRHWRMAPLIGTRGLDAKLRGLWNKASKVLGRDLRTEIGTTPYFGSQWFALSDRCVAMILTFVAAHPEFVRAYCTVYAPDEHFFQTIVANSEFGASAIQIEDRGIVTNQSAPLHQIAPSEDRYFGNGGADFDLVVRTGKFFLRKVSPQRTGTLLDRIDRELLNRSSAY